MVNTSRRSARYMMVGATPRKLHSCACTTFRARPTATPASIALPPRRRMSSPAMAAAGWLETTTPLVPWMRGRKLVRVVPGTGTMTSFATLVQVLSSVAWHHARAAGRRQATPCSAAHLQPPRLFAGSVGTVYHDSYTYRCTAGNPFGVYRGYLASATEGHEHGV